MKEPTLTCKGLLHKLFYTPGKNNKLLLKLECKHGHPFPLSLKKFLNGNWCPICKQREAKIVEKKAEQKEYEAERLYALSILSYEYRAWFHLGEPYLPPMSGMQPYITEHIGDKYPDLTQEMIHAAISYIVNQPDFYKCKIHPGPRYKPDGTVAEGQCITPEEAERNLQKYLHPTYRPANVIAYTDGGTQAAKDPWRGVWAFAVYDGNSKRLLHKDSGSVVILDRTKNIDTNSFAEVSAAIRALHWCSINGANKVDLNTDNTIVASPKTAMVSKKSANAASNDFRQAIDLYRDLCDKLGSHLVLHKIKGHSGLWGNELVDSMCRAEYSRRYQRGRIVMKELAKKRRKPWLDRQIIGTRIYVARKKRMLLRRKDAVLQYVATKIGNWMIANGERLVPRET